MLDRRVIRDLEGQVSPSHVYTRPADLAAYAYDAWGASGERHLPDAVVFPASTEEVAGIVSVCAVHRVPIVPRGAGHRVRGRRLAIAWRRNPQPCPSQPDPRPRVGSPSDPRTGGRHHRRHPRHAAAAGLYYPPDPGSSSTCTIGGNVACNAAGPHTLRYGVTADFVAGITAVLSDGRIVRLGEGGDTSASGLLSLLVGSEGTLGVITEVLLRLIPAPKTRSTLAATFTGMERAADAVAEISAAGHRSRRHSSSSTPEPSTRSARRAAATSVATALPCSSSSSRATPAPSAPIPRRPAPRSPAPARRSCSAPPSPGQAQRLWAARKAVSAAVAKVQIGKVNEDVVVPRDRVAELVAHTRELGVKHELPVVNFGHLGDGNVHATFLIDPRIEGERARADAAAGELFETVLTMGGSLSGEHGVGAAKLEYVERQLGPGTVELMRRIKTALDPHDVLNPGKKSPAASVLGVERCQQRGRVVGLVDTPGELAPVIDRQFHGGVVHEAVHVAQRPVAKSE